MSRTMLSSTTPPVSCSTGPAVEPRPPRRLSGRPAFWLVGLLSVLVLAAAGAPSPLYVVYQRQWQFSTVMLTVIFAVYAVALLIALVTVGRWSDHLGRRPLLIGGLIALTISMAVFRSADGVAWLLTARIVQGLATGALTGVLGATLIDLQPRNKPGRGALLNSTLPTAGLALGALGSGLVLEYTARPAQLMFTALTVASLIAAAAAWFLPEPVRVRYRTIPSLRPRVALPAGVRSAFVTATPALIATWAVGGLYLSLGASLLSRVLKVDNHLAAGLVVSVLTAAGSVATLVVRNAAPQRAMLAGSFALAIGTSVTLIGLNTTSVAAFYVGSAVAGFGFGASFLGAFRVIAAHTPAEERAEVFASVYVVSYLAFSVPAVLAGALAQPVGLTSTATGYGVLVIVLALASAVLELNARRRRIPRPR